MPWAFPATQTGDRLTPRTGTGSYRSPERVFRAGTVFADVRLAQCVLWRVVPRWSLREVPRSLRLTFKRQQVGLRLTLKRQLAGLLPSLRLGLNRPGESGLPGRWALLWVRSKSFATCPTERSPCWHRLTISALNSGVNERRRRGFFPMLYHDRTSFREQTPDDGCPSKRVKPNRTHRHLNRRSLDLQATWGSKIRAVLGVPTVEAQAGCSHIAWGRSRWSDQPEFVVVTHWDSVAALEAFAGPRWQEAVIEPEEEHMLAQVFCDHYETVETG